VQLPRSGDSLASIAENATLGYSGDEYKPYGGSHASLMGGVRVQSNERGRNVPFSMSSRALGSGVLRGLPFGFDLQMTKSRIGGFFQRFRHRAAELTDDLAIPGLLRYDDRLLDVR
jgi:hypothetical protein